MSNIDFEKFGRYSKAGPRYTSYPTALEFSEDFKYSDYLKVFRGTKQEAQFQYMSHLAIL